MQTPQRDRRPRWVAASERSGAASRALGPEPTPVALRAAADACDDVAAAYADEGYVILGMRAKRAANTARADAERMRRQADELEAIAAMSVEDHAREAEEIARANPGWSWDPAHLRLSNGTDDVLVRDGWWIGVVKGSVKTYGVGGAPVRFRTVGEALVMTGHLLKLKWRRRCHL